MRNVPHKFKYFGSQLVVLLWGGRGRAGAGISVADKNGTGQDYTASHYFRFACLGFLLLRLCLPQAAMLHDHNEL